MTKTHNQKIGQFGQKIAIRFLKSKGYQIIAENIYFCEGEIDILAEKENILKFIEVKTRTSLKFGYPEEGVTDEKIEHLESAMERYVVENNIQQEFQLEIVAIILDLKNKVARVKLLEYF